jgi:hypothetical protein
MGLSTVTVLDLLTITTKSPAAAMAGETPTTAIKTTHRSQGRPKVVEMFIGLSTFRI